MGDERTNERAHRRPLVSLELLTERDARVLYREGML
jgi:hypothetical protein